MFRYQYLFVIITMVFSVTTKSFAQDPDSSWMQTYQLADFDSLNVRFTGNWPFADAQSCAYDEIRGLVYLGSGGGVYVLDVTNPNAPTKISEQVRTQGYVLGLFYDSASQRLYVAAGAVGLEIWDVSNPAVPVRLGHCDTPDWALSVFVSGSYAYIAAGFAGGLRIIDITTPTNPQEVGFYNTPYYAEDVFVSGIYAYVADGLSGLRVIDISTPSNPQEVGYCDTPSRACRVYVSSAYAYIADIDSGLRVIDISTPSNPQERGHFDPTDPVWDVCISNAYAYIANHVAGLRVLDVSDPSLPDEVGQYGARSSALDIYLSGSYAYVADRGAGFRILDISMPSNPQEIGHCDTPSEAFGVAVSGSNAYVADLTTGLHVINISNPTNPQEIGHCPIGAYARKVFVSGSYAYIAAGSAGLKVIDISSPSNPQQVGYCDTPGEAYAVFVSGSYAYVADRSEGLQVIDASTPSSPQVVGHCDIPSEAWGIYISGSYAYVAAYQAGLQVIDISSPSLPQLVGSCNIPGNSIGICVTGYLAYIADNYNGGLRIIDIFNPQNPQEVGYYNTYYYYHNSFSVAVSGSYIYLGTYRAGVQIYENLMIPLITDDPLALAYNGNRHLVRESNTDNLHLVYTNYGKVVYRYSGDGGENWTIQKTIAEGEFPAICLDFQGNPCVAWTNADHHLYFAREDPSLGWVSASYSFGTSQPTHPCIAITHQDLTYTDSVHIIFRLFDNGFSSNSIREITFSSTNPHSYNTINIDNSLGANMVTLDFPSTAVDYTYKLHATWMRSDTVCYGIRALGQTRWNKWGWQFQQQGVHSGHPFIEAYGDSIFIVWQYETDGEVYRGRRHPQFPNFFWSNLSQTSFTSSIYPVNASGLVTTFVDESFPGSEYDVFWKTYPGQLLHNMSNTPTVKSVFPHTSLWISMVQAPKSYTAWLEGNAPPYVIMYKQDMINSIPLAFFTSVPGWTMPSFHLVKRDSFISSWQIPVDIGQDVVSYQFPLDPKYLYGMKAFAYKEYGNIWTMKVNIDGNIAGKIEYNANKLESLIVWINPESYKDSTVKVVFDNDVGDYTAVGPVYIYRYEVNDNGNNIGDLPGGPMSQNDHSLNNEHLTISPNPFRQSVSIRFQPQREEQYRIKAYDVSGRFVKIIYDGLMNDNRTLYWNGDDARGKAIPQGIYFLTIENLVSGKVICEKILKIE